MDLDQRTAEAAAMNLDFEAPEWQSSLRSENSRHVEITGLTVRYTGPGHHDSDAASVRTSTWVCAQSGLFYYEVTIVSKGREGFIGVGFCVSDFQPDRLPGWEVGSYGYHGDDGHAFSGSGKGRKYGPTYSTGDVIGALWNRLDRTISFFKNGVSLGVAFSDVQHERLHPSVGLRTCGEEVTANFGGSSFTTDVAALRAEARQRVEDQIAAVRIQPGSKPSSMLEELVFGYLTHSGFCETASIAARDLLGGAQEVSAFDVEAMRRRRHVSDCVISGDVHGAISATEELAPGTLQAAPGILFRLHIQIFVEMIRRKQETEALAYGRDVLASACSTKADEELFQDAATLLAYDDPVNSPVGALMTERHASQLAADLNRAILAHQGGQEKSPLERLLRQLKVAQQELQRHPVSSVVDLSKLASLTDGS